jgi:hypothetical protein
MNSPAVIAAHRLASMIGERFAAVNKIGLHLEAS